MFFHVPFVVENESIPALAVAGDATGFVKISGASASFIFTEGALSDLDSSVDGSYAVTLHVKEIGVGVKLLKFDGGVYFDDVDATST